MNTIRTMMLILLCGCKVAQHPLSEPRTASPIYASEFVTFKSSFQKADFSSCSQMNGEFISDQLCVLDANRKMEILTVLARYADKIQANDNCNDQTAGPCEMTLGKTAEMFQSDPRGFIVYNQVKSELPPDSSSSLNLISIRDLQSQKIICQSSYFAEIQLKEILCKLTLGKLDAKQNCGSICSQDSSGKPINCLCALRFKPKMRRFIEMSEAECKAVEPLPGGITFKWYSNNNSLPMGIGSRCNVNSESRCWGCFVE